MRHPFSFPLAFIAAFFLLFLTFQTQAQTARAEYVLGPGDIIKVAVHQNNDLQTEVRISEGGMISFPLIGAVKLGGLTISQAEQAIAKALREGNYLKQPQVSILVQVFRGNQASVLGHLNKPGRYPLDTADIRLSNLIALAGGITQTGGDTLILMGTREGKKIRQVIDIPDLLARSNKANDPIIQNGDIIWVDRFPLVYVYGEVQRPGNFRIERNMTIMQALAAAGGLTLRGTQNGLRVYRRDDTGQIKVLEAPLNDTVENGDVLYIRESLF